MARFDGRRFPAVQWWITASLGERLTAVAVAICLLGLAVGTAVLPGVGCDRQQGIVDRAGTELQRTSRTDHATQCTAYRKDVAVLDALPAGWQQRHRTRPYDDGLGWLAGERNYDKGLIATACA